MVFEGKSDATIASHVHYYSACGRAGGGVNAQFPRCRRGPLLWRGRWSLTDRTHVRRRPHVSDAHSLSPASSPCVAETAVVVAANVTHPLPCHPILPSSLPRSPLSFLPPFPPTFPAPFPSPLPSLPPRISCHANELSSHFDQIAFLRRLRLRPIVHLLPSSPFPRSLAHELRRL